MKAIFLIGALFGLTSAAGYSQGKVNIAFDKADSLRRELAIARNDTSIALIQADLCNSYKFFKPDSALFFGQRALTLSRQIHFPKAEANALYNLAVTSNATGNQSQALTLQLKCLKVSENYGLTVQKQTALTQLGNYYRSPGSYPKSIYYLIRALKTSDVSSEARALTLANLISTYLAINKLDSAEFYSLALTKHIEKYKTYWLSAPNLYYRGIIFCKRGDTTLAMSAFHQSLIKADRGRFNYVDIFRVDNEIAKIYQLKNKPDSAIYYSLQSLKVAKKGKLFASIASAAKLLSDLYEPRDKQKTITYSKMAIAAQDSLTAFDKKYTFKNITEFDEKERQYDIETAQRTYKNQARQYGLLAGVVVILLIVFILYRNNKKQQKANKELQRQKESINAALLQLKATQTQLIQSEKMASLGELTAGIAHEIQNPLNFVNNFSDVNREMIDELKEELQKGDIEEAIAIANDIQQNEEKINHHGKRADFIVKGMLQHSRTSTGERQLTNINVLADEFLKLSYHGLRAKDKNFNAELVTNFDENLPKVNVAQQDIGRVLLNLFNNAFYAVNEKKKTAGNDYKPEVTVSTSSTAKEIEIKIKDNCDGIPDAIKDKIMQPFFTTKPIGEGTGLGLSLSYDIVVKGHGGEIRVESAERQFTEFTVTIPA